MLGLCRVCIVLRRIHLLNRSTMMIDEFRNERELEGLDNWKALEIYVRPFPYILGIRRTSFSRIRQRSPLLRSIHGDSFSYL